MNMYERAPTQSSRTSNRGACNRRVAHLRDTQTTASLGFVGLLCAAATACVFLVQTARADDNPRAADRLFDRDSIAQRLHIGDLTRNPYVTLDEWLDESPKAPEGLCRQRRDAFYRAWATLWINTQPAQGAWSKPVISPGDRYSRGIWLWDAAFHTLGLLHGGRKARQLGLWQIEVMLSHQEASGKIPREVWTSGPRSYGRHGIQAPGILTVAANRLLHSAESDEERQTYLDALSRFYPAFVKNHAWFWSNTQTDVGLCTWTTVDAWDTSPRFDTELSAALDLNCWLHLDRSELAKMARALGKNDEAEEWDKQAEDLAGKIRALHWDEAQGIYNDIGSDGSVSSLITPVIFWPFWTGLAGAEQAEGVLKSLRDPAIFGVRWPLPSVAAGHTTFRQQDYWRGPVWINLNWVTIRGLQRCGRDAEAAELREKTLELVARTPILYEYYNPINGDGLGSGNYGWTASLYIDLVMNP